MSKRVCQPGDELRNGSFKRVRIHGRQTLEQPRGPSAARRGVAAHGASCDHLGVEENLAEQ